MNYQIRPDGRVSEVLHAPDEDLLVHDWRVARLAQSGIPRSLAEVYADHIDWREVARLVHRGCPPRLVLRIVR